MSERIDNLAQSAALAVTARFVNVIGVPLMLFAVAWLFGTVNSLEREVAKLPIEIKGMTEQIGNTNRRIDGVEQRLQRLESPYFDRKH